MLVSRVENIQNSAGDPRGVPDWEISWASSSDTDTKGECKLQSILTNILKPFKRDVYSFSALTTLTTRSVRLIQVKTTHWYLGPVHSHSIEIRVPMDLGSR